MSEECKYYYYDNGYSCALKRKQSGDSSVDSDTVHRYCWGYHYDDCPRYKNANSSSGPCYLTSACTEAKGLPDDCHELTVLRSFRDTYMATLPNGKEDIKEYYRCAPIIVSKVMELPNSKELFNKIYEELVVPCVNLIESGSNHEAYIKYKNYTNQLRELYNA